MNTRCCRYPFKCLKRQKDSVIFYNLDKKIIQISKFEREKGLTISNWFEFGFTLLQCSENELEDEDPLFIVTKNDAPVYEQLSPDAPIICKLYQGDTLDILATSDNFAVIAINDTLRGYLFRKHFNSICRK